MTRHPLPDTHPSARRTIGRISPPLWILLASLLLSAATTRAAEPPSFFFSPLDDGQPPAAEPYAIPTMGTTPLALWVATGPTATVTGPQILCANALGDELCGWQIEVQTTGAITIQSFALDSPAAGRLVSFEASNTSLRIARLNAGAPTAGDFGALRIGTLTLDIAGEGDVRIGEELEIIGAAQQRLTPPTVPILLPEPAFGLPLLLGVLGLLGAARPTSPRRPRRPVMGILFASALGSAVLGAAPVSAQYYYDTDGTAFLNAIGDVPVQVQDFDAWPVDGNGWAALDNGVDLGGLTYTSTSVTAPIALVAPDGSPTGLNGVALVFDSPQYGRVVSPGGDGSVTSPPTNDDFVLEFDTPKRAVGLMILNNSTQSGETISFLDEFDTPIEIQPMPGEAFVGYVSVPPTPPIKKIVVDEANNGTDDIYIDRITFADQIMLPDPPPFFGAGRLSSWSQIAADGSVASPFPLPPVGPEASDFVSDIAPVGDLDGDGVPDFAFGAIGDDDSQVPGGGGRGAVWVVFMNRGGTPRRVQKISDAYGFLSGFGNPGGYLANGYFGAGLTPVGNLDGDPDGTTDLAVGARIEGEGAVEILFLTPRGEVRAVQRIDADEGAGAIGGLGAILNAGSSFGSSLTLLDDIDRDGRPELVVGAMQHSSSVSLGGAVLILNLNPNGTYDLLRKIDPDDPTFAAHVTLNWFDAFGSDVESVGDLDGDGVEDLAVGALGSDVVANGMGAVYVLFLNTDGSVKDVATITPPSALGFANLDWAVTVGDEFGRSLAWIPTPAADNKGILAVGMHRFDVIDPQSLVVSPDEGAVVLLGLDETGTPQATGSIFRVQPGPGRYDVGQFAPPAGESLRFGRGLDVLGDLDYDGKPELLVTAERATIDGNANQGAAYVVSLALTDGTAFADAIAAQSGVIYSSTRFVGPPGDFGAGPTQGSSITLQFVDNVGRTDGDTNTPDLRIYRDEDLGQSGSNTLRVEVSHNGANFTALPDFSVPKNQEQIDLDLDSVLSTSDEIRFVRFSVITGCVPNPPIPNCLTLAEPVYRGVELLHSLSLTGDADFDGVNDALDNCTSVPNPDQEDADGDGWGDFCDNCPALANPDQSPLCLATRLQLLYRGIDTAPTPDRHEWDLNYVCGEQPDTGVGAALLLPDGIDPATVELGGGVNPGPPNAPGATCGNPGNNFTTTNFGGAPVGCTNADPARLGSVLDLLESGVFFPSQTQAW